MITVIIYEIIYIYKLNCLLFRELNMRGCHLMTNWSLYLEPYFLIYFIIGAPDFEMSTVK